VSAVQISFRETLSATENGCYIVVSFIRRQFQHIRGGGPIWGVVLMAAQTEDNRGRRYGRENFRSRVTANMAALRNFEDCLRSLISSESVLVEVMYRNQ
jgi:hypothetical protein